MSNSTWGLRSQNSSGTSTKEFIWVTNGMELPMFLCATQSTQWQTHCHFGAGPALLVTNACDTLSLFVKVWCRCSLCSWWHSPPSHGTAPPQGWWCSRRHTPDNKRLIFAKSSKLKLKPAPHTWQQKVDICKVFEIKIKAGTTHFITRGEYLTSLLKFIPSPVWDFLLTNHPFFHQLLCIGNFLGTFCTHLKKTLRYTFFYQKELLCRPLLCIF